MNYYLSRNGDKQGPFPMDVLQRMVGEGTAMVTDLVWAEGMPSWVPLMTVLPVPGGPPPYQPPLPQVPISAALPNYGSVTPAGIVPPNLHWGVVLLCTFFSFGIFYWVWAFVQANFTRRLDPANDARLLLILSVVASIFSRGGVLLFFMRDLWELLWLAGVILLIVTMFRMRAAMETYYTNVEPIGLRLSPVMTFFFGVFYLQYHMARIAQWKRTGVLTPQ